MPIAIEVVSKERFAEWIATKQKENGITPPAPAGTAPATPAAAAPAPTPVAAAAPAAAPAA
jgi:cytochrome c oxidase subunit 2